MVNDADKPSIPAFSACGTAELKSGGVELASKIWPQT